MASSPGKAAAAPPSNSSSETSRTVSEGVSSISDKADDMAAAQTSATVQTEPNNSRPRRSLRDSRKNKLNSEGEERHRNSTTSTSSDLRSSSRRRSDRLSTSNRSSDGGKHHRSRDSPSRGRQNQHPKKVKDRSRSSSRTHRKRRSRRNNNSNMKREGGASDGNASSESEEEEGEDKKKGNKHACDRLPGEARHSARKSRTPKNKAKSLGSLCLPPPKWKAASEKKMDDQDIVKALTSISCVEEDTPAKLSSERGFLAELGRSFSGDNSLFAKLSQSVTVARKEADTLVAKFSSSLTSLIGLDFEDEDEDEDEKDATSEVAAPPSHLSKPRVGSLSPTKSQVASTSSRSLRRRRKSNPNDDKSDSPSPSSSFRSRSLSPTSGQKSEFISPSRRPRRGRKSLPKPLMKDDANDLEVTPYKSKSRCLSPSASPRVRSLSPTKSQGPGTPTQNLRRRRKSNPNDDFPAAFSLRKPRRARSLSLSPLSGQKPVFFSPSRRQRRSQKSLPKPPIKDDSKDLESTPCKSKSRSLSPSVSRAAKASAASSPRKLRRGRKSHLRVGDANATEAMTDDLDSQIQPDKPKSALHCVGETTIALGGGGGSGKSNRQSPGRSKSMLDGDALRHFVTGQPALSKRSMQSVPSPQIRNRPRPRRSNHNSYNNVVVGNPDKASTEATEHLDTREKRNSLSSVKGHVGDRDKASTEITKNLDSRFHSEKPNSLSLLREPSLSSLAKPSLCAEDIPIKMPFCGDRSSPRRSKSMLDGDVLQTFSSSCPIRSEDSMLSSLSPRVHRNFLKFERMVSDATLAADDDTISVQVFEQTDNLSSPIQSSPPLLSPHVRVLHCPKYIKSDKGSGGSEDEGGEEGKEYLQLDWSSMSNATTFPAEVTQPAFKGEEGQEKESSQLGWSLINNVTTRDRATLESLANQLLEGLVIKDRTYRLRKYKKCFITSEAVDYMVAQGIAKSRAEAVVLGTAFQKELNLWHHVVDNHVFSDNYLFFRLSRDENDNITINKSISAADSISNGDDMSSIRSSCAGQDELLTTAKDPQAINHSGTTTTATTYDFALLGDAGTN